MCDCGSSIDFNECCGPYLTGQAWPPTAEALMRSRYTAFVKSDISYLKKTVGGAAAREFNEAEAKRWASESEWRGLEILSTEKGRPSDSTGTVEFVARYRQDGQDLEHHEISKFRKDSQGHWMFEDGESHLHEDGQGHRPEQFVRQEPKTGRNDPCPCGSGKKFKKCCGE
ncbi:MAG: YchJ family protein [Bdellovibrionales bacterium]